MLQLYWSDESQEDLLTLIEYVAARNLPAAKSLKDAIEQAVLHLVDHPYLFRSGRVPGTREIVVHPKGVLRVLHARRQYP
jgi:toxin ParE1/3/4